MVRKVWEFLLFNIPVCSTLSLFSICSTWSSILSDRFCLHITGVRVKKKRFCYKIGGGEQLLNLILMLQVLNQEETPLLYSLVFGEGVVNDATSVVLFNAIQKFDLSHITSKNIMQFIGNFFYLLLTSTLLGVVVC